jgi:hypothetical protein
MSEEIIKDVDSLVDFVLGDDSEMNYHSPEAQDEKADVSEMPPEFDSDAELFEPYGEDDDEEEPIDSDSGKQPESEAEKQQPADAPATADSAPSEEVKPEETNTVDYQAEIAKLEKRLHDTQKAYHESNARAAEFQKRLENLESKAANKEKKEASEDDWFEDDSEDEKTDSALKKELNDIRQRSETLEARQEEIQHQANLNAWHTAAAPVRAEHPDFDELVYQKLEPLLDEQTGDSRIRMLYMQQEDRSPAAAYKFARSLSTILEMLDDPDGFHTRMESLKNEIKNASSIKETQPRAAKGKAALDMVNSAEFADDPKKAPRSLVDELFGED